MITKPNGWDQVKPYTEAERLPAGGYVLEIKQAKVENYGYGDTLVLSFDILEGEYKDFYANQYRSQTGEDKKWKGTYRCKLPTGDGSEQDEWSQRRLKTMVFALQDSNAGYTWDWDETKLKGKRVGGVFNNKEYEINGRTGFYTACHHLTDVETIRKGNVKIPEDTLLKGKGARTAMSPAINPADFEEVGGDLPF